MKKIEAIIRPDKMEELQDALAQAGVKGMTISQVHGCGKQLGLKEYYRGQEVLVTTQAKIKFEIVLEDAKCDEVVDLIINTARTGEIGDGKVFVYNVEEAIRIRTNGRGADAL
jgi:nitrogen regulatory protein P-II 1